MHALYFTPKIFNSSFIFSIRWCFGTSFCWLDSNHMKHILQVFSPVFFFSFSTKPFTWCTILPSTVIAFDIRGSRYHLEWHLLKRKSFKFQTMLYNLIYLCRVFHIFRFDTNFESGLVRIYELFIGSHDSNNGKFGHSLLNCKCQSNGLDDCKIYFSWITENFKC